MNNDKDEMLKSAILYQATNSYQAGVQHYLENGRRYRGLSEEDLPREFVDAFCALVGDLGDGNVRDRVSSLEAECVARGKEPPYDLVEEEFERLADLAKAEMTAMTERDDLEMQCAALRALSDALNNQQ